MKGWLRIIQAIILIGIFTAGTGSLSFAQQKTVRQASLEAFSRGEYEQAYLGFKELLVTYPKDPLYKYYSGVCILKLNGDAEKALSLLIQAQQGSTVVRTLPGDLLFWIGRAQQMTGRFEEAISSYNSFTDQFGKKAARDLEIPALIQQCGERKGKLQNQGVSEPVPETRPEKPEKIKADTTEPAVAEADKPEHRSRIDTIPAGFDQTLSEALELQWKADSLIKAADDLKGKLENLDYKSKIELRSKIAGIEKLAADFQQKADMKYSEAQASMNATTFSSVTIPQPEIVQAADSAKIRQGEIRDTVVVKPPPAEAPLKAEPDKVDQPAADEFVKTEPVRLQPAATIDVFSVFEINQDANGSNEKIPVNASVPPGLIYRIQVAVFRNPVSASYFKGISPVCGFRLPGIEYTTYYAGMFRRIDDARKALIPVRQKGFKDAFIAALSGGKNVSMERAALLEKEWGQKPLFTEQAAIQMPADTIPPELCFRIEVTRSEKPLKPDILESMKKAAGTKGLDTESLENGPTIYLIGKFITYESASDYADLLVRNGYREAHVVARLGKKEVPVEMARELFDRIQ